MIILDSDHLTLLEWGGPCAMAIDRYIFVHAPNDVPSTTIISFHEQVRGWLGLISSSKNLAAEIEIYQRLNAQRIFYSKLNVLLFTEAAAIEFQQLQKQKLRLGTMDLKIAAIALANNATLLTRNLKDFSRIPRLLAVDATK